MKTQISDSDVENVFSVELTVACRGTLRILNSLCHWLGTSHNGQTFPPTVVKPKTLTMNYVLLHQGGPTPSYCY